MAKKPRIEADVKKEVKKWLEVRGCWYYMPVQNGMGKTGIPDFICCLPDGRFLAIETKAPGIEHVTANQHDNLVAIREACGFAIVVNDVSQLDDLERYHAEIITR